MKCRLVDAEAVRRIRERAVRLRKGVLTYIFGTIIKQTLEELDLWDELPEGGDGGHDT